ncbi:MAG TPA: hypothetical protein VFV52_16205 [Bacilli bacterium]|nr:hypothetical protein [Bacilli bacterium]
MQINNNHLDVIEDVRDFYQHFRQKGLSPSLASSRTFHELLDGFTEEDKASVVMAYLSLSEQILLDEQVDSETRLLLVRDRLKKLTVEKEYLEAFTTSLYQNRNRESIPVIHQILLQITDCLIPLPYKPFSHSQMMTTPEEVIYCVDVLAAH